MHVAHNLVQRTCAWAPGEARGVLLATPVLAARMHMGPCLLAWSSVGLTS